MGCLQFSAQVHFRNGHLQNWKLKGKGPLHTSQNPLSLIETASVAALHPLPTSKPSSTRVVLHCSFVSSCSAVSRFYINQSSNPSLKVQLGSYTAKSLKVRYIQWNPFRAANCNTRQVYSTKFGRLILYGHCHMFFGPSSLLSTAPYVLTNVLKLGLQRKSIEWNTNRYNSKLHGSKHAT